MRIQLYRLLVALAAACMLAACGGHSDDDVPLVASTILGGRAQLPANASTAIASGTVTVDRDRLTLIASVYTEDISETEVHLHIGAPGASGAVIAPLLRIGTSTLWVGETTLDESQWTALRQGNFYLDVHSAAYPAGELRGQLIDAFPPDEHIVQLLQAAPQSPLIDRQLRQLEDYEDWWHGDSRSGVGLGLSFGF